MTNKGYPSESFSSCRLFLGNPPSDRWKKPSPYSLSNATFIATYGWLLFICYR
jgi:hypothetical protein